MKPTLINHPLIELQHCSLILEEEKILDDVSFALRPGERWALIGPNGSGKSMLLKMLRGDVWPTPLGSEQRLYRFGRTVNREPAGSKEHIAYIGPERQDKYVRYGWDLTVEQVVTTGLFDEDIPLTTPTGSQRAKVDRALQRFGLTRLRERRILALSYGQRRLTLVARAFAGPARVLLLDEVFNGLDARVRAKLLRGLEQARGGHEWILTSHRPHELPKSVTNVASIEKGKLEVVNRSGGPRTGAGPVPRGMGLKRKKPASVSLSSSGPAPQAPRAVAGPFLVLKNVDLYRDYRLVLRDVNWTIERGEHWAILGANGSGKSTLLNLLHGDLHPALGGTVLRAGFKRGSHIEEWKRKVGWVSPELQADHYLAASIEEIVISGRYASVGLNEPPTAADRKAAARWLEFFGITKLAARKPRQVSYGQMRLALIARALVNSPLLLLLDEPCTGLDGDVRAHVLEVIERLAQQGTQLVMAVHDKEDMVPSVGKVLRIGKGEVRATHWPTGQPATGPQQTKKK
jgi:molybdate transport system ATP-binding protein